MAGENEACVEVPEWNKIFKTDHKCEQLVDVEMVQ